jgi:diguanylate cyclase (GGDEF)-like protein
VPPASDPNLGPDEGTRYRAGVRDPVAMDVLLRRARWLAAVLCCVQFSLYVPPDGITLPFSRWWGGLPTGLLLALNLEGLRRARRGRAGAPDWTAFQLVGDSVVVAVLIGMFTFDPTSALWTLMIMPVLEAAVRGWSRRAVVVFAVLATAYVLRDLVATFVVHRPGGSVDSVTYRLGVLAIITMAAATLTGRLTRQIADTRAAQAEADQLRDLAVATRRMSTLDVPTVVREVTQAAEAFGFRDVQLWSRSGALLGERPEAEVPWRPGVDRFAATAAATETGGYVVLDAREADCELPPGEALVVASVTAGDTVEALLSVRHPVPVVRLHAEGLALLAAQASAALGNALRFEEGRAYEQRLAHLASHDALTGLPNRGLMRDRARSVLAHGRQSRTLAALMYIDLDRFKEINDVLGHSTGDRLLQGVAQRVLREIGQDDTCARIGGDEFVVVTGGHRDETSILELARRVRGALSRPFALDGVQLDVEASLGLAWAPTHGDDADVLLRRADVAMYAAKARHEGVVVYHQSDDRLTPLHLSTLGDLRRALDAQGQLEPWFQPIVELSDGVRGGCLSGVEALVRWHHPVRGTVGPDEFIPIAEQTSVIHQVTDRVLQRSLESQRTWTAAGHQIGLAVNISAPVLLEATFTHRLSAMLARNGIGPESLRLEITETALLSDPARATATMHRLRDLGVRMSIDDFGTGYSSMSYLRTLPLDEIKIDRSFVLDMVRSHRDAAVVQSVVDLAHSLGLRVVAEGVEDQATLEALADIGCDLAQGFHIGHPMTASDLLGWAERRPVPRTAARLAEGRTGSEPCPPRPRGVAS